MFPEAEHDPSLDGKLAVCLSIASHITLKLRLPEFAIALRFDAMQRATVPEAAVDKDSYSSAYEYKIRPETIDSMMQAISKAQCPGRTT
jgi:hypothetical protein